MMTFGRPFDLDQMIQLPAHDVWAAKWPVQDCLVEHDLDLRRVFSSKNLLPLVPFLDPFFNCRFVKSWYSRMVDRANVIGDLEDPRNNGGLENRQRDSILLQAHVCSVRQGERLPPALLLAFPRQRHEPLSFGVVGDAVQLAQVPDVAKRRATVACLHPAHLGRRAQEFRGHLVDGQASRHYAMPAAAPRVHACEPWGCRWSCALPALEVASFRRSLTQASMSAHKKTLVVPMLRYMPLAHEYVTWLWHLPTAHARCTMKSVSRRHPQATRRQRGRAVTRRVTDPRSLANRASREPAILTRRPAITAYSLRPLPLCASARALTIATQARAPPPGITARPALRRQPRESRTPEIPLGRCCHTDPAKHHPSSGTTEKG